MFQTHRSLDSLLPNLWPYSKRDYPLRHAVLGNLRTAFTLVCFEVSYVETFLSQTCVYTCNSSQTAAKSCYAISPRAAVHLLNFYYPYFCFYSTTVLVSELTIQSIRLFLFTVEPR